jgi:hypothetical protein
MHVLEREKKPLPALPKKPNSHTRYIDLEQNILNPDLPAWPAALSSGGDENAYFAQTQREANYASSRVKTFEQHVD